MASLAEALEKVHLNGTTSPDAKTLRENHEAQEETKKEKEDKVEEEAEDEEEEETGPVTPFPFFDLPSEIRLRIYSFVLFTPRRRKRPQPVPKRPNGTVGASSKNPPLAPLSERLALFLVSRRMHNEATDFFYSSQTFRIFQIQDHSRTPTVRLIPSQYLPSVATIELILGSSWTAPPKSWTVNRSLGLEQMTRVRTLKVFIECDPSHPVFEGFRISPNFYTEFAGGLLRQIIKRLPNLAYVEFDGYPSVRKSGSLMKRLLFETRVSGAKVAWGPERGWTDWDGEELEPPFVRGTKVNEFVCADEVPPPTLSVLNV
ncbi:uncharacterized protein BDW47DRAFT_112407 [Aspergillus candidus]|uniref:F-box domain-containing protein n=1 Tax=Aspergillus candidus TaxID=41067 RepID=A0A2I2F148_ASPCN|nr:hypothetical protein BDW47DRAFT_112407 [Aspergillus candidus]PLB34326.1 hypothetical protein BDW47DRAFT_112407 [Aspergillus candidus]